MNEQREPISWLRCLALTVVIIAASLNTVSAAMAQAAPMAPGASRILYPAGRTPKLGLPGGRQVEIHSLLKVSRPMQFGDFLWNEDNVPQGSLWVRIDLSRQVISVFRGGDEIGTAVILYGADDKPTPTGSFPVLEKSAHYYSHTYHAPMPYMLRLTDDGVAIHGSSVREGWATHGCIGVPLDFARLLFSAAHKGTEVVILPA